MEAKNNFLRKVMPLVRSAWTLAREKEVVVAEAHAESHTELRSLREENRAMREQILELTGLARGKSPSLTVCTSSFVLFRSFIGLLCSSGIRCLSVGDRGKETPV